MTPIGFTNSESTKTATLSDLVEAMNRLAAMNRATDRMFVSHPDNIAKLTCLSVPEPDREQMRLRFGNLYDGLPLIPSVHVPKTRKTGRVIWEHDPYVTYEDKDREWGLKLGFCKEEEETVFYSVPRIPSLITCST